MLTDGYLAAAAAVSITFSTDLVNDKVGTAADGCCMV